MKRWNEILKNLTLLTQFGLSLITPLLLCLGLCWYLCEHTGLEGWIFIPGFIFGLGGSATFAWKFYLMTMKKDKKEAKKRGGISFNRH